MFSNQIFGAFRVPEMPQELKDAIADKKRMSLRRQLIGAPVYLPRFLANLAHAGDAERAQAYNRLGITVFEKHPEKGELLIVEAPKDWQVKPIDECADDLLLVDDQGRNRMGIAFVGKGEGWSLQGVFMPLVQIAQYEREGQQVGSVIIGSQSFKMFEVDAADSEGQVHASRAFESALAQVLPRYADVAAYWEVPNGEIVEKVQQVAATMRAAL